MTGGIPYELLRASNALLDGEESCKLQHCWGRGATEHRCLSRGMSRKCVALHTARGCGDALAIVSDSFPCCSPATCGVEDASNFPRCLNVLIFGSRKASVLVVLRHSTGSLCLFCSDVGGLSFWGLFAMFHPPSCTLKFPLSALQTLV